MCLIEKMAVTQTMVGLAWNRNILIQIVILLILLSDMDSIYGIAHGNNFSCQMDYIFKEGTLPSRKGPQ